MLLQDPPQGMQDLLAADSAVVGVVVSFCNQKKYAVIAEFD